MGPLPPPFRWTHLWQWHVGWLPNILLLASLALYVAGARRVPGWSRWRTLSFVLGVVATFLATQSVLGVYDMVLFSAHMVEHLALIMVAAPCSRSPRRSTSRPRRCAAGPGPPSTPSSTGRSGASCSIRSSASSPTPCSSRSRT